MGRPTDGNGDAELGSAEVRKRLKAARITLLKFRAGGVYRPDPDPQRHPAVAPLLAKHREAERRAFRERSKTDPATTRELMVLAEAAVAALEAVGPLPPPLTNAELDELVKAAKGSK